MRLGDGQDLGMALGDGWDLNGRATNRVTRSKHWPSGWMLSRGNVRSQVPVSTPMSTTGLPTLGLGLGWLRTSRAWLMPVLMTWPITLLAERPLCAGVRE